MLPNLNTQYCTFELNNMLFGVPVCHVQEVLRYQELMPVPLAPKSVSGLMNLRGHIVVAIDLRLRLGMPERSACQRPMNVVVQSPDGPISLLVDDIGDMLEVAADDFELPPTTMQGVGAGLIIGTYKLPNRLLLVLDPNKTVDLSDEETTSIQS